VRSSAGARRGRRRRRSGRASKEKRIKRRREGMNFVGVLESSGDG
jgi:hypothetical protein